MKKGVIGLFILFTITNTHAALQEIVWGSPSQSMPSRHANLSSPYHLKLILQTPKSSSHQRFQLTYNGIPIWGHQLIFHKKPGKSWFVTGINVTNIEADLPNTKEKLSLTQVEQILLSTVHTRIKFKKALKIIYLDNDQKAHLAYHVSFYTHHSMKSISAPNYIIDANDGKILKQWDNLHHQLIGQGLGGNAFSLPYRLGSFQYGNAIQGMPALGPFDVDIVNDGCLVQNQSIQVINLGNKVLDTDFFPISLDDEVAHDLHSYRYPCSEETYYFNVVDGTAGPVNYAFSPINDTMFFAQNTIEMYANRYKIEQPLGTDLPLRAYTHLGDMDDAFAIPTIFENGTLRSHQQIIIGNGNLVFTALSQTAIAHELSHIFTELNSGLIYQGQSGAINEAFSDMSAIALEDYIRTSYPWYWDGKDWTIGREAMLGGKALRYMDDPTKDGDSIDHAKNYNDSLDVHYSSGVFNKGFYLLSRQPGWSIRKAFQAMVDANRHYWQPSSDFNFAVCGVIQAAIDRGLEQCDVVNAFSKVGVICQFPLRQNITSPCIINPTLVYP